MLRTRWRRTVALVAVLVVLGGAAAAGLHVWTHPRALEDQGAASFVPAPRPVSGFALHVGVASGAGGGEENLVLQDLRPRWSENAASAEARFSVCTERRPPDGGSLRLGTEGPEFDPQDLCTAYRPFRPGMRLHVTPDGEGGDYVVATLTARHAGRAVLESVDVTYRRDGRHLRQHGTQRLRQHVVLRVTPGR